MSFAAAVAWRVLSLFESDCPDDGRPRQALEVAAEVVAGDRRSKVRRDAAWAALRAARDAPSAAAAQAARSAGAAVGAAYLHPLADVAQLRD